MALTICMRMSSSTATSRYPGDKVRVHGAAIRLPYGERLVEHRMATVTRATALGRAWTRFRARFEITELYEISFSNGQKL